MIHYTRGTKVVIQTIFYDSSATIANPDSVNITFAYPDGSTGADWPFDGNELLTTTIAMTSPASTTGIWTTTWDSAPSNTGTVYWTAVPADPIYGITEGQFTLRGGLANPTAVPTTL